jgi:hypothetical protein
MQVKQMSKEWILDSKNNRILDAVGLDKVLEKKIRSSIFVPILAKIDETGKVIFYELDDNANIINEFIP